MIIGVTFVTFIMGYFSPDDPIRAQLGVHFTVSTWQRLRHAYGLDLPWYQQYYNYLVNLVHFNLGTSFEAQNRPVWDILKDGVPTSLELAFWGTMITVFIGIPSGIVSAVKANSWIDTTNMAVALIFYALPIFVFAIFAQLLITWVNGILGTSWPISGWGDAWHYTWSDIQTRLVPVMLYGAAGYAYIARLTRTTMLEVLQQDYVRTARSKGLLEKAVIYQHALRNALIPLITVIGLYIGLLVAGSFYVEYIFNIPGIAEISVQSIFKLDYPVIQATVIIIAIGVVIGNLLSDVLYTIVDPRIKLA